MTAASYATVFVIALVVFLAIDLLWLGVVAKDMYAHFIGDLLRDKPNWPAALLFYAIFVVGLIYFAIAPAIENSSLRDALVKGGLYGFFTYATYDLTNYAVAKGFPGALVPIDIAWGVVLAASVASLTYTIYDKVS